MIKIFNVYYPTRALLRLFCETLLIGGSFLLAATYFLGPDTYIGLMYENGLLKIAGITVFTLLLSYYFDLYEPRRIPERWEIYFRLLLVLSALSFILAALTYFLPNVDIGHNVFAAGVFILSIALVVWRRFDEWMTSLPVFRERTYILGTGDRAYNLINTLKNRPDAGIEVVGWTGANGPDSDHTAAVADLRALCRPEGGVDRVIVAMEDRRGTMPIRELLDLRLRGVIVEDETSLIEKLSGRLPLEGLFPSTVIFSNGFKVKASQQIARRIVSFCTAGIALLICLPFLPFIALAVRLSSPGPILFKQTRVGLHGRPFTTLKFRTMRQDAEAGGAKWATKNDPRITGLGKFMRKTRLDEVPQLWNVLRGDMAFVGPRPERPEFVEWLNREIPYYDLRHMIRPGLTGWAQVRYQYGASLEETRRKLEFDLYYLKHLSIGLDLLIMFETIKTIVLRRGAQ